MNHLRCLRSVYLYYLSKDKAIEMKRFVTHSQGNVYMVIHFFQIWIQISQETIYLAFARICTDVFYSLTCVSSLGHTPMRPVNDTRIDLHY